MGVAAVTPSQFVGLAVLGLLAGLGLFGRGLLAYRRRSLVSGIATSRIASLAAGEVRVSGTVRAAAVTLVSPLQSRPCVYFRSRVVETFGRERRTVLAEERGVDFLVDDGSGQVHVFPRAARFDLPARFADRDGALGDAPAGLQPNAGPEIALAAPDREAAIADLLTVHQPAAIDRGSAGLGGAGVLTGLGGGRREYSELRLEPGDVVTVIGTALPFADLPDPANADRVDGPLGALADPEIAADLEAARAAGTLVGDPQAAWGNAAIEGFGIGQPVRAPVLDPAATPEPVAPPATDSAARGRFEIAPDALVLASGPTTPLAILAGSPGEAAGRAEDAFLLGLAGAVLAIASAVVLALSLSPIR
ncbi:MAG TPA: hypothetical protein VF763_08620 [Candidatus Limnocylindrales bacterium]